MRMRVWVRVAVAVVSLTAAGAALSAPAARMGSDLTGLKVMAMDEATGASVEVAVVKAGQFAGRLQVPAGDYRLYAVCPATFQDCPTFQMDEATVGGVASKLRRQGGFVLTMAATPTVALVNGRLSATGKDSPVEGGVIIAPSWDDANSSDARDMMLTALERGAKTTIDANGVETVAVTFICVVGKRGYLDQCYKQQGRDLPTREEASVLRGVQHAPVASNGRIAEGLKVRVRFVMAAADLR